MIYSTLEGIHCTQKRVAMPFSHILASPPHTQTNKLGGQGRRPTPTTNPRGNNALLPLHTIQTDLGGHSQTVRPEPTHTPPTGGREPQPHPTKNTTGRRKKHVTTPPKKKHPRRVNNYPYRDLTKALKRKSRRTNAPCWICGQPIDYTADWRSKWSFTADHVDPIALGGNPRGELRPAHRSCNSRRGDTRNNSEKLRVRKPAKKSRNW